MTIETTTDATNTAEITDQAGEGAKSGVSDAKAGGATGDVAGSDKPENLLGGAEGDPAKAGDKVSEAEGGKKEGEDDAGKDSKEAAPIEYTDFTAPEGVEIDKALLDAVVPVLKELGLPQDGAQKLVDFYAGLQVKQAEAWASQVNDWAKETRSDKELASGEGFDANVAVAQHAIRELFPDMEERKSFLGLIVQTGIQNHPLMVKFCLRAGKQFADDKIERGDGGSGGPRNLAHSMYPNNIPQK